MSVKPSYVQEIETRLEKLEEKDLALEKRINDELNQLNVRLTDLNVRMTNFDTAQATNSSITISIKQGMDLILEAYGGTEGLKKAKARNERIDAKFASTDGFFQDLKLNGRKAASWLIISLGVAAILYLFLHLPGVWDQFRQDNKLSIMKSD